MLTMVEPHFFGRRGKSSFSTHGLARRRRGPLHFRGAHQTHANDKVGHPLLLPGGHVDRASHDFHQFRLGKPRGLLPRLRSSSDTRSLDCAVPLMVTDCPA